MFERRSDEAHVSVDGDRFEAWYREHHGMLRALCARLLGDPAAAEDVAQETLLRAWSNRASFDGRGDIKAWLFRVARNLAVDHVRARSRVIACENLPEAPALDADPSDPLEREEEHRAVRAALETLNERYREILMLREVHGIGYVELASRFGLTEQTARVTLFRARRGLRERFLAASRATAAVIWWPFARAYNRARRATEAAGAHPAAFAALQAGLAGAAAIVISIAPTFPATSSEARVTGAGTTAASAPVWSPGPALEEEAGGPAPSRAPESLTSSRRLIAANVDREGGDVHLRSTVRSPVTGDDEYVWARVWREHGGDDSEVLSGVDDAADDACATGEIACVTLDDAIAETTEAQR